MKKFIVAVLLVIPSIGFGLTIDLRGPNFRFGLPGTDGAVVHSFVDDNDLRHLYHTSEVIKSNPILVEILGHASVAECAKFDCYALSMRRASLVADLLRLFGVSSDRIKSIHGCGADLPLVTDPADKRAAINQRVELVMVLPDA